MKRENISSY